MIKPTALSIKKVLDKTFGIPGFEVGLKGWKLKISFKEQILLCWLDEWMNKQPIILSRISSLLGITKRIHARNCKVISIDKKTARDFLEQYHLLAYANAYFKYGLLYKDELVAVALFSKGRKMNRLKAPALSYELVRYANAGGCTVVGGLSRLLAHFIQTVQPGDIMTYIDKEWSDGKAFLNLGFHFEAATEAQKFLIDTMTQKRYPMKRVPDEIRHEMETDEKRFEVAENAGNLKLVKLL